MSNPTTFVVKRLLGALIVIWLIATIIFFLGHTTPYDPIARVLGKNKLINPGAYYKIQHQRGWNLPLWQQYLHHMGNLLHGNLGYSEQLQTFDHPVRDILARAAPISIKLMTYSLALSLIVAFPLGLFSALKQNSWFGHGSEAITMIAWVIPTIVIAPVCQQVFAVHLGWLPAGGWDNHRMFGGQEMIMPATILATGLTGLFARSFHTWLLDTAPQGYMRTSQADGMKDRTLIYVYALQNHLVPSALLVGRTIEFLLVGAFLIENLFSIPGIFAIMEDAVLMADFPVIEATVLMLAIVIVVVHTVRDILYALVDSRVGL